MEETNNIFGLRTFPWWEVALISYKHHALGGWSISNYRDIVPNALTLYFSEQDCPNPLDLSPTLHCPPDTSFINEYSCG